MNFMSALRRTSPLAFASLVLIMAAAAPSDASHTFKDSGRFAGNMLYPDLEQAGDHVINYALCANPVPWEWTAGVENWDTSFGTSMDFNGVACLSNQETKLTWEGADGSCPPGASACWLYPLPGEYVTHGDHFDLLNGHRVILFNSVIYYQFSPSCRVSISAHEWGHNMSLEDHDAENPCTIGSIMGKGGIDPASNSCVESPTGKDMTTVWCVVYRSCSWHGFQDWGPAADLTPGGIAYAQRAARLCSHGPPVLRRFLLEVLDGRRVDRLGKT